MKTAKILIQNYKDSDGWFSLCSDLGLLKDENESHDIVYKYFQYGEYANIEIIIDENFNIVGGKIIPFKNECK